jgi:hypothetical protein
MQGTPQNNAFKLTSSQWSVDAWRHFVPPCVGYGGTSQLNAMFSGRVTMQLERRGVVASGT